MATATGCFLLIGKRGGKSWMVRVQKDGRRRDIGLGGASKVSLKLARERATEVRCLIEAGIDPVAERYKAAGIPTFREPAALVHAEHKSGWKNAKHLTQWLTTLENYAFPKFGEWSVADVDAGAVRDALAAIWLAKPETARRLRQRIRTVIDWDVAKGYRDTALAMSVIDKALPKRRTKVRHHAALPYAELPAFLAALRARASMGRLALEAAILTAARFGEVRLATWRELDLDAATWKIPAERMKADREHVAPLPAQALALFERMKSHKRGDILLNLPAGMSLQNRTRRWIAGAGGNYQAGVSKVTIIGGRLSKVDESTHANARANAANVVRYMLKAAGEEIGAAHGWMRARQGGPIIGKRCGSTQNIGQIQKIKTIIDHV